MRRVVCLLVDTPRHTTSGCMVGTAGVSVSGLRAVSRRRLVPDRRGSGNSAASTQTVGETRLSSALVKQRSVP